MKSNSQTKIFSLEKAVVLKLSDYIVFSKFRLSLLVVFSAAIVYLLASESFNYADFLYLITGGFLVTASSNGFNQIIERDFDKMMQRTHLRPLVTGRMSLPEAYLVASLFGVVGITILWFRLNPLCGILGAMALFLYVLLYTPLKRISPISVFVGAFPGSIPPMIGWVAATGKFGVEPGLLFLVQFAWQFPHFWSIAWKLDADYSLAGFKMLPSIKGKNKASALIILITTLSVIPAGLLPFIFNISGIYYLIFSIILVALLILNSVLLFIYLKEKYATRLMFFSFLYLPLLFIIMYLDKL